MDANFGKTEIEYVKHVSHYIERERKLCTSFRLGSGILMQPLEMNFGALRETDHYESTLYFVSQLLLSSGKGN